AGHCLQVGSRRSWDRRSLAGVSACQPRPPTGTPERPRWVRPRLTAKPSRLWRQSHHCQELPTNCAAYGAASRKNNSHAEPGVVLLTLRNEITRRWVKRSIAPANSSSRQVSTPARPRPQKSPPGALVPRLASLASLGAVPHALGGLPSQRTVCASLTSGSSKPEKSCRAARHHERTPLRMPS